VLDLRDLEFLTTLARRKHFARAAEECGVSQPAFSMRVRKIEERLGVAVVKRGNRFQGFTSEGEALLRHAHKIISDLKVMEQDLRSAKGEVGGTLTVGVIPTAVTFAAQAVKTLHAQHPRIRINLQTASSLAIQQGLEDGQFEAGITYSEGVVGDLLRMDTLYQENYFLLAPRPIAPREKGSATWAEAADLPLCLLDKSMQNRRIIDNVFRDLGLTPNVTAEASAFLASIVLAAEGMSATIVPERLARIFSQIKGLGALRLTDPVLEKAVCLVSPARDLSLPAVDALRAVCLPLDKQHLW